MGIKASEIIQAVVLTDQVIASLLRILREGKDLEGADEPALKAQLAALRKRNDERFAELDAILAERSGE